MPRDLSGMDLNLLPKFRALYRCRSVSRAGAELHLTQSAVSNALAKMRVYFGDKLFIRTVDGMEPTPLARQLAEPIDRALENLEAGFRSIHVFEPSESARSFNLAMTQLAEAWLAPQLVAQLALVAPQIHLRIVPADANRLVLDMRDRTVDFAVGDLPELECTDYFEDRELAPHDFVCIVRRGHAVSRQGFSRGSVLDTSFIEVNERGTGYSALRKAVIRRAGVGTVRMSTTNALTVPLIVAKTDLVGIVPRWLAEQDSHRYGLVIVPLPCEQPTGGVRLFWQSTNVTDAGHQWLQAFIGSAAEALASEPESSTADRRRLQCLH